MIEPTDEMLDVFDRACDAAIEDDGFYTKDDREIRLRAGLAAVLAIVERDYDVRRPLCMQSNPDDWGALCELWRGHEGNHRARVTQQREWSP